MKDTLQMMIALLIFIAGFGIYDLICVLWYPNYIFILGTQALAILMLIPITYWLADEVEMVDGEEAIERIAKAYGTTDV